MHVNILIVEDDPLVQRVLRQTLAKQGYSIHLAESGSRALELARQLKPDAVILDLGLPDLSGRDIFRILRNDPDTQNIPILILTGLDQENQEAQMLLNGADDYITKPFDVQVLIARVQNLIRRRERNAAEHDRLQVGPLSLDSRNRIVVPDGGEAIRLSPKEFEILYLLAKEHPNAVTRDTISRKVWGTAPEAIHPRVIDVHVRNIRLRLGKQSPAIIEAVSRHGYLLRFR